MPTVNDLMYRWLITALPVAVGDGTEEPKPAGKLMGSSHIIHFNATAPEAEEVLASRSLGERGTYRIDVFIYLSGTGTPAAIDADNVRLYYDGPVQDIVIIPVKHIAQPIQTIFAQVSADGFVDLTVNNNATADVEYRGTFVTTRVGD